jgi:cyclopropane fatty-acyl-phospholipid synthase-like methyltransferase
MKFTAEDIALKNREIYDDTSGPVWQLAIYGAVHQGREFINLGGARVLDQIACFAKLNGHKNVVELCAGRGAVCRYLAEQWGCRITGVEWNAKQAESGRAMLARMPEQVADRVRIVNADCLAWLPEALVDTVVSVDSMMLLPDVPAVLRHSRSMLRDGGEAFIVTIGAGEAITAETRQFAWEIDGMASLYSCDEYTRLLDDAGFRSSVVTDITPLAIETSDRIDAALHAHRAGIVELAGEDVFRGWVEVGAQYLAAFRRRELAYLLASARKQSENVAITDNAAEPRSNYHSSRIEVLNTRYA